MYILFIISVLRFIAYISLSKKAIFTHLLVRDLAQASEAIGAICLLQPLLVLGLHGSISVSALTLAVLFGK